ncbi:thiamine pyrophosphate-dependent enzyme [Thermus scotoductus]|uniref:thiamine pyrophosphate-dependent enzyme n=1 Tax=Thermus scotoductus TaxID=37636 RepID=UPI00264989C1|nr:thiamine pyrophosphate-dependent enzyme [Thermus scotoductus]
MALFELRLDPSQTVVFSGIGCSAKTPHYLNVYGVHTLHGRVLPVAQGAKLANPHLAVVAVGGDGVHVEVHPNPKVALSDNQQQMDFRQFEAFLKAIEDLLGA